MRLEEILLPFLAIKDDKGRLRNVVLVGHTLHADLKILENCGLDLGSLTSVSAYIDVSRTWSDIFGDDSHNMSLKRICQRYKIRTCGFHNAAHDALCTLQALLKLFYFHRVNQMASFCSNLLLSQDGMEGDRTMLWEAQLEVLRFIGEELGNVLLTGSSGVRHRRQHKEGHFPHSMPGTIVEAIELKQNGRRKKYF
jgi:hypothetical protein